MECSLLLYWELKGIKRDYSVSLYFGHFNSAIIFYLISKQCFLYFKNLSLYLYQKFNLDLYQHNTQRIDSYYHMKNYFEIFGNIKS